MRRFSRNLNLATQERAIDIAMVYNDGADEANMDPADAVDEAAGRQHRLILQLEANASEARNHLAASQKALNAAISELGY